MKKVHYNDLASLVGQEIGVSDWVQIDQDRVLRADPSVSVILTIDVTRSPGIGTRSSVPS